MDNDYIKREGAIGVVLGLTPTKWFVPVDAVTFNLKRLPAADVRQVVLCKDCKYLVKEDEHEMWCNGFCQPARLVAPDDYCSRGVRRSGQ